MVDGRPRPVADARDAVSADRSPEHWSHSSFGYSRRLQPDIMSADLERVLTKELLRDRRGPQRAGEWAA